MKICVFFILFMGLFSGNLRADVPLDFSAAGGPIESAAADQSFFRVGFSNQYFLSSAYKLDRRNYQFALVDVSVKKEWTIVDIQSRWAFNNYLLNSVNIPQVYAVKKWSNSELRVGRSLWDWSFVEDEFRLGLWEPLYKAQPLQRERQGLSGLFYVEGKPDNQLMVFASPLYIPHQGANFSIKGNGQFDGINPWFPLPPRKVKLFSGSTELSDIEYHLVRPRDEDIAQRFSFGLWWQVKSDSAYSRFSFLSKPDSQILISYLGSYNTATDRGEADIYPQIQRHRVTTWDGGIDRKTYKADISLSNIYYDELFASSNLTFTSFRRQSSLAALRLQVPWNFYTFKTSYFWTDIYSQSDSGPNAYQSTALTPQIPLTEAVKVGLNAKLDPLFSQVFEGELEYLWSPRNQLEQVSFLFLSKWQTGVLLFTKLELLQAAELTAGNTNEISRSAINDFIELGVTYEF